jgi:hypothetical protein
MNAMTTSAALRAELAAILTRVRRRWRLRRALLGTVWFLGASAIVALIAVTTVDGWRFAPEVVTGARIASYLTIAVALLYFIGIPVFQRVSDRRLALYMEEREPSLGMALASATELEDNTADGNSAALERGLLEQTLSACHDVDDGRRVDAPKLRRNALLVAASIAVIFLVADLLPANLRYAFELVFLPRTSVATVNPYRLTVEPGDILVSKGADQLIVAHTEGFEPNEVELLTRFGNDSDWQRAPMVPGGNERSFEMFLFDLARSGEYQVISEGLRSQTYRIEVAELPKVKDIALTYHSPPRLNLPPKTVADDGDISAVRGSRVAVTIVPDQDVGNATLVRDGDQKLPMTRNEDGTWSTELAIDEEGHYRIDLPYGDDTQVAASPNYAIEVLPDRAPLVKLSRFGRDSKVTSVEEALIEVTGHDDLNIATLELVYAVNDQPEKTVVLYWGDEANSDVTAGHTLELEEYELSPGDLIAYYARAADSTAEDALTSTTDIFFMEVRPFDRNFRRSQGGGGGAGMQGGQRERSLSAQQRELVIATFKVARDRDGYDEDSFTKTTDTLETAQARIRDRVEAIVRRIGNRNVMQRNAGIQKMREELPLAIAAMQEAEQRLMEKSPAEALPPARKALQHLQRAEAAFRDAQIAFGRSTGRGARDAEDLANLFRLEMDKLRNKYESVQRGNWKQGSQQLDEALEKLKELARRQQQEIERLERRARLDPDSPSGGGSQRALAEELEEMVRRLERLSREQQTPQLRNLIRQAQAAAKAMRRATGNDGNGVADARAALDRLRNIQRLADNQPDRKLQRGIDNASQRAKRLQQEHADIGTGVEGLPEEERARSEQKTRLQSRKLRMAEEVRDLESDLRELAKDARKQKPKASRALRGTADAIDKDELPDKIERSAAAIDGPSKETSRRMEADVGESLQRIGRGIGQAADSVDQSEEQKRARNLAQMRDLVKGLESLERQMLQRSRSGQSGQATTGDPRTGWGTDDNQAWMNRDFDPTEIDDFRRDFAERRGLLERLAGALTADEHGARDISRLVDEMRKFEQNEGFDDPQRAMERQRQLIAQLKELELRLNSDLDQPETDALPLTGNDSVSPEYRPQVEEYFRNLSRAESSPRVAD